MAPDLHQDSHNHIQPTLSSAPFAAQEWLEYTKAFRGSASPRGELGSGRLEGSLWIFSIILTHHHVNC